MQTREGNDESLMLDKQIINYFELSQTHTQGTLFFVDMNFYHNNVRHDVQRLFSIFSNFRNASHQHC